MFSRFQVGVKYSMANRMAWWACGVNGLYGTD